MLPLFGVRTSSRILHADSAPSGITTFTATSYSVPGCNPLRTACRTWAVKRSCVSDWWIPYLMNIVPITLFSCFVVFRFLSFFLNLQEDFKFENIWFKSFICNLSKFSGYNVSILLLCYKYANFNNMASMCFFLA